MEKYKLLSLDIWDTILRRRCHPDEIKIALSRFLFLTQFSILKENYRNIDILMNKRVEIEREIGQSRIEQYDDEYELREVFRNLLNVVLTSSETGYIEEVVNQLYKYELQQEKDNIYLDSNIVNTIEQIEYEKLAYVSDFYADTNFLDSLLEHVGFDKKIDFKYSSCEKLFNKRSGRLFDLVHKELNLMPNEHIHIGDNKHSDVKIPKSKGIESIYYINANEVQNKDLLNRNFENRKEKVELYFQQGAITKENTVKDKAYKLGQEKSLIFFGFVSWIIEDAIKKGVKKIYYFTREGEFFKKIHDEIARANPYGTNMPQAEVLEVSRIATFGASIREVTLAEMMRLWNQYSIQKPKAFFKSLNIDAEKVLKYLDTYAIDINEEITYPWLDERMQQLFQDVAFKQLISNEIKEQKEKLKQYFLTKGLDDNDEAIGIVDIGWRGTIQDNIAYIYPQKYLNGYYIGLVPFLNEQPNNCCKYGYINDYFHADKLLRFITPIEMLCNSPNGSTLSYKNENGKMVAMRNTEKGENRIYEEYTTYFQQGVIDNCCQLTNKVKMHGLVYENYSAMAYEKLKGLLTNPDRELAKKYFELKHNEEFGVGGFVDKTTRFRPELFIRGLCAKKYRIELIDFLNSTSWPQGYLCKYNLKMCNKLYNERLLRGY